ncbi:MAG: hypothetical protein K0S48_2131 [Ramlibacter sp.]|nr:hypothetical protein [Ramlibacter sp.]
MLTGAGDPKLHLRALDAVEALLRRLDAQPPSRARRAGR